MKVLLVANEPIARARLKRLFAARPGVHISEAASEYDAVTLVRTEPPALILLDLDPPGLGSLELLRRMLTAYPEARVLVLRMEPNTLDAARALHIGAAGYLSKNTSPEELMEAVRRVVGGARYIEAGVAQALALKATEIGSPKTRLTERDLKTRTDAASSHFCLPCSSRGSR